MSGGGSLINLVETVSVGKSGRSTFSVSTTLSGTGIGLCENDGAGGSTGGARGSRARCANSIALLCVAPVSHNHDLALTPRRQMYV
jgi:hypothetical protein